MATLTPLIPATPDVSNTNINQWTGGTSGWTDGAAGGGGFADIDEAVGSIAASGETAAAPALNHNTTNELLVTNLSNVDSDFGDMATLRLNYDAALPDNSSAPTDDEPVLLEVRITASDGTTEYVTWVTLSNWTVAGGWTGLAGQPAANHDVALTLTATGDTASLSDWNGARIHFRFSATKVKGNDNATPILIVDARLTGTYNLTAAIDLDLLSSTTFFSPTLDGEIILALFDASPTFPSPTVADSSIDLTVLSSTTFFSIVLDGVIVLDEGHISAS